MMVISWILHRVACFICSKFWRNVVPPSSVISDMCDIFYKNVLEQSAVLELRNWNVFCRVFWICIASAVQTCMCYNAAQPPNGTSVLHFAEILNLILPALQYFSQNCKYTGTVIVLVMFSICILEAASLNLNQITDYPDSGFLWYSSDYWGVCSKSAMKWTTTPFFDILTSQDPNWNCIGH